MERSDGARLRSFTFWVRRPGQDWECYYQAGDGRAGCSEIPPGRASFLALTGDGLVTPILTVQFEEGETVGPRSMILEPGSFFRGRFLDPEGKQAQVKVRAVLESDPDLVLPGSHDRAGADGRYRLGPVPPGIYRLEFTSPVFAGGMVRSLRAGPGETIETDPTLVIGGSLEVRVTVGRQPERSARVNVRPDSAVPVWGTWPRRTGEDGPLIACGLPTGWLQVDVELLDGRKRTERVEIVAGKRTGGIVAF